MPKKTMLRMPRLSSQQTPTSDGTGRIGKTRLILSKMLRDPAGEARGQAGSWGSTSRAWLAESSNLCCMAFVIFPILRTLAIFDNLTTRSILAVRRSPGLVFSWVSIAMTSKGIVVIRSSRNHPCHEQQ